jgi:hypothetical protein
MTSSCIRLKSAKIAMLDCLRLAQKLGYYLKMEAIFSFVVDADLRFVAQTRLFLASLMAQGVPARAIHAHVTPNTGKAARAVLQKAGVNTHVLQPFLDGKYCNKLVQLDTLLGFEADWLAQCRGIASKAGRYAQSAA